jgi:hypothetical protein
MTLTTLINRQIDLQTLKQVKFKSLAAAAVAKLVKYLTLLSTYWMFESSQPVDIVNKNGEIICDYLQINNEKVD